MSGPTVISVGHLATSPSVGSKVMGDEATEGGGGRGGGGGVEANDVNAMGSVYTSSSYASSRGLRRSSVGKVSAGPRQGTGPVPPPRGKVALSTASGIAAPGIMKSSSEIFISTSTLPRGILKTASTLGMPSAAPLSRSSSGGAVVSSTTRVNFSATVSHIEAPPSPPILLPDAPSGPSVRTSLRSADVCDSNASRNAAAQQQQLQQGREAPQRAPRQKDSEKHESSGHAAKVQLSREADTSDAKKLRQQQQQQQQQQQHQQHQHQQQQLQREASRPEALKQQLRQKQQQQFQKSARIDIPEPRQRREEVYFIDQHSQQLIRAGSLGSGEPAAILQQRSRSPLPSAGPPRAPAGVPPIVHASKRDAHVAAPPEERKGSLTSAAPAAQLERIRRIEKSLSSPSIRSGEVAEAAKSSPVSADARAGVITAAAKAYTENFQTYSYSSYLTKTRKDSASAKDAPALKDLDAPVEGRPSQPPPPPTDSGGARAPPPTQQTPAATFNGPAQRHHSRSTAGKIIIPLAPSGKPQEAPAEKPLGKAPITGDKDCVIPRPEAATGRPPSQTIPADHLPQRHQTPKEQASSGSLPQQPRVGQHPQQKDRGQSSSSEGPPPIRNTPAPSVPPKKPPKTLPPLLSGLRFPLAGDRMKGSSEGALLMACRVAEEDQIVKLLKELTATSALDATALNQADRSGRTSLSYCCANAYLRVVETLTSMSGIDINKPDTDGNTPLHYAAQAGHTEVVSHLVNKCNRSVDLDARNALGFTPLMKAALQGRTKIAKILLFAGASPHLRDFGRGLCAVEWARYTGRHVCSELIDSVQKSCSSHIRDRWTSDPDLKSHSSGSLSALGQADNKESWIKHKIKKAFHKSESKKEFSVVTNLSTMAVCATSPLLPTAVSSQDLKPHQVVVPHVQVTEVKVPDCYEDPEDALSRLPPSPPPPLPAEEASTSTKGSKKGSKTASSPPSSSPPSGDPAASTKKRK